MQRAAVFLLGVSLFLGSCNKKGDNSTALLEAKISNRPIVGIVPLIDHSRSDLNWDLSHELSQAIRKRLVEKNQLYMVSAEPVAAMAEKAFSTHDPFDIDTTWVRKSFPENEFVVFMELLEHQEIPFVSKEDAPAELTLTVRVRVIDLREKTPKVVLQETIEQSHHIPWQFTQANSDPDAEQLVQQVRWGDEAFDVSPLGIAHDKLCKEIATRIEDYILIAGRR